MLFEIDDKLHLQLNQPVNQNIHSCQKIAIQFLNIFVPCVSKKMDTIFLREFQSSGLIRSPFIVTITNIMTAYNSMHTNMIQ